MHKVWVEFLRTEPFLAVNYGWRQGRRVRIDKGTANGWVQTGLAKIVSEREAAVLPQAETAMIDSPVRRGRRRAE